MPKAITDIEILKQYITGVMLRADHHADEVKAVALTIAGAIIWKKDAGPIKALTLKGEMKNVLWVPINGKNYAFSYNHVNGTIEMRKKSTQGDAIKSFSNKTPPFSIWEFFNGL